jgi:SAM domain (Sterile alpha motif)
MSSFYWLHSSLTRLPLRFTQGRNLAGKVGLFPQTYTQPVPPSAEPPPAALSTLAPPVQAEDAPSPTSSLPNPMTATFQSLPKDSDLSPTANDVQPNLFASKSNGEVMLATMTDVQKAIEQLGHNDDFDGSRSFTFSSTRGESTDHDTDAEADGEDWHKGARQKLAEKAKKAAEMQAIRDAENGRVPMRSTVPPIDVEMSEDSGDEDEHPLHDLSPNGRTRRHSHIPEVDEEDPVPPQTQDRPPIPDSSSIQPSSHYLVPSPLQPAPEFSQDRATESDVPTATQSLFPQNLMPHTPENNNSSLPTPVSPNLRGISNGVTAGSNDATHHVPSAQLPFPSKSHHQTLSLQEAAGILPSPAASFTGHRPGYSISSINSSARVNASSPLSGVRSADLSAKKPRHVHPTDWTVEEVVDWLRSKGFDDAVCEKFIEQEITGDVLLELDVAVLKSEIGITAYGKRMRIWNAITELRRPPSLMSSSAEQLTRGGSFSQRSAPLQHGKTPSSSLMISTGSNIPVSPESPNSGDMAAASLMPLRRDSDPGVRSPIVSNATDSNATIGLGIGIPPSLIPGNAQSKAAVRCYSTTLTKWLR